jgi:hypothetical protein
MLLLAGGGRMLLLAHGDLKWLYPDGRTVQIASGFAGAMPEGGKLLAWKHANPPGASRFLPHGCSDPDCTRIHDLSYYTMNLDGSDSRLVLPAEPPVGNTAFQYENAQLSPDGSRLAYISQELRNGTKNYSSAQVSSGRWMATGQKTALAPTPPTYGWRQHNHPRRLARTSIVVAPPGQEQDNLPHGARPAPDRGPASGRPGRDQPASITLDASSPGTGASTRGIAGRPGPAGQQHHHGQSKSTVQNSRVLATLAAGKWITLTMKLGRKRIFLLLSQVNATARISGTTATISIAHSQQLTRVPSIPSAWAPGCESRRNRDRLWRRDHQSRAGAAAATRRGMSELQIKQLLGRELCWPGNGSWRWATSLLDRPVGFAATRRRRSRRVRTQPQRGRTTATKGQRDVAAGQWSRGVEAADSHYRTSASRGSAPEPRPSLGDGVRGSSLLPEQAGPYPGPWAARLWYDRPCRADPCRPGEPGWPEDADREILVAAPVACLSCESNASGNTMHYLGHARTSSDTTPSSAGRGRTRTARNGRARQLIRGFPISPCVGR